MNVLMARVTQIIIPKIDRTWVVIGLILLLVAMLDQAQLLPTIQFALSALASTGPYILIAVLLIGGLKATGAEVVVAQAFAGREARMILAAALFGGLAPFCSCEVIPFVAALLAAGAPISAVMAFWLSSPLIDPPSLMITAGALGWHFAVGKAILAVMVGLFGGYITMAATRAGWFPDPLKATAPKQSCCSSSPLSGRPVWRFWGEAERRERFRGAAVENALFLLKWISLAYVLESLMIRYIPAEAIASVVGGDGVGPVFLAALVGVPAYLNSYAAPPLVSGLMVQGMSAGAAMAFMIAGAVSCIPAMTAVFALVKRQVFAAYVLLGLAAAVLAGLIYGLSVV